MTNEFLKPSITNLRTLALGFMATAPLLLSPNPALAQLQGDLHLTKECSAYTGLAGSYCTFKSSNLDAVKVGSVVLYDQPVGTPAGFLDSNVLLYTGPLDWATGRCTVDFSQASAKPPALVGICTFSDGTGQFTGFQARVNVTGLGGVDYAWDGTYSFAPPGALK